MFYSIRTTPTRKEIIAASPEYPALTIGALDTTYPGDPRVTLKESLRFSATNLRAIADLLDEQPKIIEQPIKKFTL